MKIEIQQHAVREFRDLEVGDIFLYFDAPYMVMHDTYLRNVDIAYNAISLKDGVLHSFADENEVCLMNAKLTLTYEE